MGRKRPNGNIGKQFISAIEYSYLKGTRDFNSPEYRFWRKKVQVRDGKTCQMPDCGSKKAIKVHHILRWADAPSLRYEVDNGICLCRICHDMITGYELHYVDLFTQIVLENKNKQEK